MFYELFEMQNKNVLFNLCFFGSCNFQWLVHYNCLAAVVFLNRLLVIKSTRNH